MIPRCMRSLLPLVVLLLCASSVAADELGTYRQFKLGAPPADVLAATGAAERQVRTLHERPALLQELSWRPPYTSSRNTADRDSVAAVVFSFIDNQLFRMAISYDKSRTEGLTREDMVKALTTIYGPAAARPTAGARAPFQSLDTPTPLATWQAGGTTMTLNQVPYGEGFGLIITSVPLETHARKAQAAAVSMDAREAPAREAARAKAEAEAKRASAEKTRTTNREVFKP